MSHKKHTILIVDDNMNNIQVLANILSTNNYDVEFAMNGVDALDWVKEENFDLILLDVMMPKMDGFEVCEKIRSHKKNKDLPIIFLTAKTDKESLLHGFEQGGNDYITKPFDQKELLARVNTHIELKTSKDKLATMNVQLEEKVLERTEELKLALDIVNDLNKKLLSLDKAKSEFLKIISHEIRTPLNGIVGFTEIIKQTNKDEPLVELIGLLEKSVIRLENFSINALLITSLRLGRRKTEKQSILLQKLVNSVINTFNISLTEKNIVCKLNIPNNLIINADKELLEFFIRNITQNAIKYTPPYSEIIINGKNTGDYNEIEIIDSGTGFSKDALDNLFDSFYMEGSHQDQHAGLGLSLANQIAIAHNGQIKITNPEGKGAAVKLIIPV